MTLGEVVSNRSAMRRSDTIGSVVGLDGLETPSFGMTSGGSRLKWVGDVELRYERWGLGSRLRWIGDLELGYEEGIQGWLGDRPKYIMLPDEHSQLTVEDLLSVFFVLYEKDRREEEQRRDT
jgi:hypothetical protein